MGDHSKEQIASYRELAKYLLLQNPTLHIKELQSKVAERYPEAGQMQGLKFHALVNLVVRRELETESRKAERWLHSGWRTHGRMRKSDTAELIALAQLVVTTAEDRGDIRSAVAALGEHLNALEWTAERTAKGYKLLRKEKRDDEES